MKKNLVFLVLLTLVLAVFLCACGDRGGGGGGNKDKIDNEGWEAIEATNPADVYTKLLAGFTTVASDFSNASLKNSPKLSLDSKLKLEVNGNEFWVTLKTNYNNNAKDEIMLALELSTLEDTYSSNILAAYLYKEKLSIGLGETKVAFNLPTENWQDAFPFDMTLDSSKTIQKIAFVLAATIELEDEPIKGKTRLNGTVEEFNFDLKINLAKTLKRMYEYTQLPSSSNTAEFADFMDKFGIIINNIFGVSASDIKDGKFPKSTLSLNFTTSDRKISAFKFALDLKATEKPDTMLFAGENLNIELELIKFATSKKDNVNIDFVVNCDKQEEYIDYIDKAFNVKADVKRTEKDDTTAKNYELDITAKIFQENPIDNYLFVELKNKSGNNLEKAAYFYDNTVYYYTMINNTLECVYSFELDITDLASRILNNDLDQTETSKLDMFNMLSYFIGALKVNENGVKFFVLNSFFTDVFHNFENMLHYIDSLYDEDLSEIPEFADLYDFVVNTNSEIYLSYDKSFVNVYTDNDAKVISIINKITQSEPTNILTPQENEPTD